MKLLRYIFVWLLPLVWGLCSYIAFAYPGDEYAMWAVGSIAGTWIVMVLGNVGDTQDLRVPVALTGMVVMAGVGYGLDRLRVHWIAFGVAWVLAGAVFVYSSLTSFASYEAAMAKNGSLAAYVLLASNMGLYVAVALTAPPTLVLRLGRRGLRAESAEE